MKSRKIFTAVVSFLLVALMSLALFACGGTKCESHTDKDGDGICDTEGCNEPVETTDELPKDAFNEKGELILFKGGVPTFQFVIGADEVMTQTENIEAIAKTLTSLGDGTEIKTVTPSDEEMTVEILIGTVDTRGEQYKLNKYSYGVNGYAVKQIGTKIVVIGGSNTSLNKAVDYLKTTVFGLKKTNSKFGDFVMAADLNVDNVQSNYKLKEVTINGTPINDYTIYYTRNSQAGKKLAESFQTELYTKAGIYLEITTKEPAGKAIKFVSSTNTGVGNGYTVQVDDSSNLVFDCEFEYRFEELAKSTFQRKITTASGKVALSKGTIETQDIRNLYYDNVYTDEKGNKVGGAVGNGEVNDFEAIRGIHELANKYGHTVNARLDGTAIYRIDGTDGKSAIIMTDTYWHGCKFIFNDASIPVHDSSSYATACTIPNCVDCANRRSPVFNVQYKESGAGVKHLFAQYTKENPLKGGFGESDNTTKIPGWNLPYLSLVLIKTYDAKIYIRQGNNADNGDHQSEIILVHPDGTIDPSTPLSFDYTSIDYALAYNVDERYVTPITIDGMGKDGKRTEIETIANNPGDNNRYNAFRRNIAVERSNVTIMNFNHVVTEEQLYRAPYEGICYTSNCHNVTWKDITIDRQYRKFEDKNGNKVSQGTYEIGGRYANKVSFYNVDCSNFFANGSPYDFHQSGSSPLKPGSLPHGGTMGSNYCRNFLFDTCELPTFDSHKGLGNVTLIRSTFRSILIQGSGEAVIEDCKIFSSSVVALREDYGPSWNGNLTVKDIDVYRSASENDPIMIINTYKPNLTTDYDSIKNPEYDVNYNPNVPEYIEDGKCSLYLPQNMYISNVNVHRYSYTTYDERTDTIDMTVKDTNKLSIYLYNTFVYDKGDTDISKYTENSQKTIIVSTKSIVISNCGDNVVLPSAAQFSNTKCTVNGKEIDLY